MILATTMLLFCNHSLATPPPSLKDYASLPRISQMTISASGNRIAYRQTLEDEDTIIIRNISDMSIVGGINNIAEVKPRQLRFVSDDKLLLLSESNLKLIRYRGRHDVRSASVYDVKDQELYYILQPGFGIHASNLNLSRIAGVSPDTNEVYMQVLMPMTRQLEDKKTVYSVVRASLERKRRPKRHINGTEDTRDYFLDKQGQPLARERYDNLSNTHRLESYINGEWKLIYENEESELLYVDFSGITPDRKSIVMKKTNKGSDHSAYYKIDLANGEISGPISEKADKDVQSVVTDINRIVYGIQYSGFEPSYEFFDEALNSHYREIIKGLPEQSVWIQDFTSDWKNIVLYVEGSASSGAYLLYSEGKFKLLASARPEIAAKFVHPVQDYAYIARDGWEIPSLVTLPKNQDHKNLPAIMLPHGGPGSHDKKGFDYTAQYFAEKGYAVIQPQFRGSSGFGNKHYQKGKGEWAKAMQDDLTDAINDLAKKGLVDANRVCIVGGSYGGYAALAGATFTPDVYKCAVSINGISDLALMLKTEREKYGRHHWAVSYWEDLINNGNVKRDYVSKISPINFIDNVDIPILLIHGERDTVVEFQQSKNMYETLNDANKQAKLVELDNGDHFLRNAENRKQAMMAIGEFVDEHLN